MFEKLSGIEKAAARIVNVNARDLVFIRRTCYGDLYGLNNGVVFVDGVFYGYSRRDIYRSLLRKLLNRYGVINETPRAYLEYLKTKV